MAHYTEIRDPGEVQIYEAILEDTKGAVTTGILTAVDYAKDNRLLPRGFDKDSVPAEISVHGGAATDSHFDDHGHRLRYSIDVHGAPGPFKVLAELLYQPIGFRWAGNFKPYNAPETQRFTDFYSAMARGNAVALVKIESRIPARRDNAK